MMKPETRIRVYFAAEDWVQGVRRKEILAKYDISSSTYYRWMKSAAWEKAVAGRVGQERPPTTRYPKHTELDAMRTAAIRYVAVGSPPIHEYADQLAMPVSRLEEWMETAFWKATILYAEYKKATVEKAKNATVKAGKRFPYDLLRQAVFLSLYGWSAEKIGPAVGRSPWTIRDWEKTDAWAEMTDELLLDKLMMHMLDTGTTVQEMIRKIMDSQWQL